MKKIATLALSIFLLACGLVSCKSGGPKENAEKFVTALAHMDYEKAKEFATDETKTTLDLFASFSSMYPDSIVAAAKKTSVQIKEVKEEGNNATVTYAVSDDPNAIKTIEMVKNDKGEWKAHLDKANPGGENNPPSDITTDPAMDTITAPPVQDTTL